METDKQMSAMAFNFSLWMKQTTGLSDSSIYKYSRAVINDSKDMYKYRCNSQAAYRHEYH